MFLKFFFESHFFSVFLTMEPSQEPRFLTQMMMMGSSSSLLHCASHSTSSSTQIQEIGKMILQHCWWICLRRMASFSIIGHQMGNWEWNFYKNEIIGTQTSFFLPILVVNWVSSCLFFSLSASTSVPTYIYLHCSNLYKLLTITTLEPCAWNAEFQHFICQNF